MVGVVVFWACMRWPCKPMLDILKHERWMKILDCKASEGEVLPMHVGEVTPHLALAQ